MPHYRLLMTSLANDLCATQDRPILFGLNLLRLFNISLHQLQDPDEIEMEDIDFTILKEFLDQIKMHLEL